MKHLSCNGRQDKSVSLDMRGPHFRHRQVAMLSTAIVLSAIPGAVSAGGFIERVDASNSPIIISSADTLSNTYVTFDGGTLQFENDLRLSGIVYTLESGGATFDTHGNQAELNVVISGEGSLAAIGNGVLVLEGMNNYTGATTIDDGSTLRIVNYGKISSSQSVTVDGTLDFNGYDAVVDARTAVIKELYGSGSILLGDQTLQTDGGLFSGVISGDMGLTVQSGTLVLTGDNEFTGQAASGDNGILQIGDGGTTGSVKGNILNIGGLVFKRADTMTYDGPITGRGAFTVTGGGTFVLTNNSSGAGNILIDTDTTLQWGNGGAAGWYGGGGSNVGVITNKGQLVVDRSSDKTYQGVITGTGSLIKRGSGTLGLSKTNLYSGQTVVEAGSLIVDGAIAASNQTTVLGGATLGGVGQVGSTVIATGATLAPGSSLSSGQTTGTLTVVGDLSLGAGSFYSVKVDADGGSSRVQAFGVVEINPTAQVRVRAGDGEDGSSYGRLNNYAILSGQNGVDGRFDSTVDHDFAFLDAFLGYSENEVVLQLLRNDVVLSDVALTPNQRGVAAALDGFDKSGAVYQELLGMSAEQAQSAYQSASGEVHASSQHVVAQTFDLFSNSLGRGMRAALPDRGPVEPMGYVAAPANAGIAAIQDIETPQVATGQSQTAWLNPFAGRGVVESDGNAGQLDWSAWGIALGYEGTTALAGGSLSYGGGVGYLISNGSVPARSSSYASEGGFAGLYGGWTDGALSVSGDMVYGATAVSTLRTITIGAIEETATADYWVHSVGLGLETSYGFALGDGFTVSPVGALDTAWFGHNGAMEAGAGVLNAAIDAAGYWKLDTGLGLEIAHTTQTDSGEMTLKGRALWQHGFGSDVPAQTLALSGGGTSFNVNGASGNRDRLVLGAGIGFVANNNTSLSLDYSGTFSDTGSDHGLGAVISTKF